MNTKMCIIGVYFGQFPQYINLWIESCKYNREIDFLIFTDSILENIPNNVKMIKFTLKKFSNLASKKLNLDIRILKPYKCCDFKPVYGKIFEDFVKEYAFWGHCDFDLIFGDIRKFITNDMLLKYDKILPLGHLSFYRNTKECNDRYMLSGSKLDNYKKIFTNEKNYAFDEISGIHQIYIKNKFPYYSKRIFADISILYKRFKLALNDKNYRYQVFYWEEGKVYRAFLKKRKICIEEFIYIHFKKRKFELEKIEGSNINSFFITQYGFFTKNGGIPTLSDIKKYNNYDGIFCETNIKIKSNINKYIRKLKNIKKKVKLKR